MQMRKAAKPYISEETKALVEDKKSAWSKYKSSGDITDHQNYKHLTKLVHRAVAVDRKDWLMADHDHAATPKAAWAKAKKLLGTDSTVGSKAI